MSNGRAQIVDHFDAKGLTRGKFRNSGRPCHAAEDNEFPVNSSVNFQRWHSGN